VAGLELAVISLGAGVVKSACRLWLGNSGPAADASSELIDMFAGRMSDRLEQRKLGRLFEECADIVARRLRTLLDAEFRGVLDNERTAAVLAVADTFAAVELSDETLLQADLDARAVERRLRPAAAAIAAKATLSEGGEQVYWLVLRESCTYLVEVVTTLPRFTAGALTELLHRETAVLESLSRVLDKLPERRGVDDFAADYRRAVANRLDRLELLGVTSVDVNRRYPLSIAYIDLGLVRHARRSRQQSGRLVMRSGSDDDRFGGQGGLRAASVLRRSPRALVVGHAGSGKTTLLQWLAVRSALADFTEPLDIWNGTVPFFIPLRRYADRALPVPEEFPLAVGRNIAQEMPSGWVHGLLREGRALVLIDGVDELPEAQRDQARDWLGGLIGDFGRARYVVSSRPMAIREGWLSGLEFQEMELQPMSASDVTEFIGQWHRAMAAEIPDAQEARALAGYERSLITAIDADRHLRALAVNPLLCALLCALNRERRTQLPRDRMEIYEAALEMLLERRDRERGVDAGRLWLTRTDKTFLLQDIAFWLVRNGWSDAPSDRVVGQIGRSLRQLHQISAEAPDVFRALLERSGVLREPAVGRVDFIHRTFQEYLAAKAAVDNDEIGLLVANSHDDQWREVVVMAAGHASPDQCAELLRGLLKRRRKERYYAGRIGPLAVVCLQTARRLDPQVRADVEQLARKLVPPPSVEAADALAGAGELLLDLLRTQPPRTPAEEGASIHAASRVGGDSALRLIRDILSRHGGSAKGFENEIAGAWRFFNPDVYVKEVLAPSWPPEAELRVPDVESLRMLADFPGLRWLHCELGNSHLDDSRLALTALERNRELRHLVITGCGDDLDLAPLANLPHLESLELECPGELPNLAPLAGVSREWGLTLSAPAYAGSPLSLSGLASLTWLSLRGCDSLTNLGMLAGLPESVWWLSLYGFAQLTSLDGIAGATGLRTLELFDCPRVTSLAPLASVTSLEHISLGLLTRRPPDLTPLADLPRLATITLAGHTEFDVAALAGMQDVTITVPPKARVTGAEEIAPSTRIVRSGDSYGKEG